MRKIKFVTVLLIVSILFVGCAGAGFGDASIQTKSIPNNEVASPAQQSVEESIADTDDVSDEKNSTSKGVKKDSVSLDTAENSQQETPKVTERKIIRNADLRLEDDLPEDVQQKITTIAESKKGFVIQSTKSSNNAITRGRNSVSMTIRVPAEKFNESLEEIRKATDRVIVESVTGRDVTEEFIDIQARLKTKKALEEKFLEIMKQSKNVGEALNVQRELANVRGEIERIEGRKRFLENQASLSTIKISIQTPNTVSASPTGFFYELTESVSDGFDGALTFILILVRIIIALIPFLLLVVLPFFLILRYFWKRYKRKKVINKTVKEEIDVE